MLPALKDRDRLYPKPETVREVYSLRAFRGTPHFWQRRLWLVGIPVALCLLWLGTECVLGNWHVFQAGKVSEAHHPSVSASHAGFNQQCTRCHTRPFAALLRLAPWNADLHSVTDDACATCHRQQMQPGESFFPVEHIHRDSSKEWHGRPAPSHHADLATPPACAACHPEHRGKPKLAAVEDRACTVCHADLNTVSARDSRPGDVSAFVSDHPDFRARVRPDPGRLAFNHAVHLKPEGIPVTRDQRRQLTCADCHQPGPNGHLMTTVRYDQHCASCHPLSIQIVGDFAVPALARAVGEFNRIPALHREPAIVRANLRQRYEQAIRKHPGLLNAPRTPEPLVFLPGRNRQEHLPANQEDWVRFQLQTAERILFNGPGGCRYCHHPSQTTRPLAGGRSLPAFMPSSIPDRWFHHATFRHEVPGHREEDCSRCHRATASRTHRDVLLPGIGVCRNCHGRREEARTACGSCHRYHDTPGTKP
jgi:hypothetical protein